MTPRVLIWVLAPLCAVLIDGQAAAQTPASIGPGATVRVDTAAPVYLFPDASRTPLRTLAAGVTATVERTSGEWVQITYFDQQFGRRTAWILAKFISATGSAGPTARPGPAPGAPPDFEGRSRPPTDQRAEARRPRNPRAPSVRLVGTFAFTQMAARESFAAITGSESLPSFGGGVQGVNLWHGLFVEGGVEHTSKQGERVFVFRDAVFPLGIPVKITTTPIDLIGGWRFPAGRITPYVGAGASYMRYKETSDFADEEENVESWHPGWVALVGVEARLMPTVHLRGEARIRRFDNALGQHGVSREFGETDLGGTGASVKIAFGF